MTIDMSAYSPEQLAALDAEAALAMGAVAAMTKVVRPEPQWCPHKPSERQKLFLDLDCSEAFYGGAAGGGKQVPLSTPIPTPDGFTQNGDLRVGDRVFDENGQICRVTTLFPTELPQVAYRLTFDDGSQIDACSEHQWLTFDAKELGALTRRDPVWRARRRARRESRVLGTKSKKFTASLIARNMANPPPSLPPPTGSIRTTEEIYQTLYTKKGRANHAIPVAGALNLLDADLPIDPYTLGLWLGDGMSASGRIGMALADADEIKVPYVRGTRKIREPNGVTSFSAFATDYYPDLHVRLKQAGLINNKHVPTVYLRGSRSQRLALLQGLMDTDGTVSDGGSAEFANTNKLLIDAAHELIVSLGWKARIIEGRARCNGEDHGPVWNIKWTPSDYVFRLPRKCRKQKLAVRRTTRFRYIVDCRPIEPEPMRCIAVDAPSHLYLVGRSMIPTHNSDALLMAALQYVHVPGYAAILFRRTLTDLALPESLIPRSFEWLKGRTPAVWHEKESLGVPGRTWVFPSGATLTFGYLDTEVDKYRYQSSAYQFVGFDEVTQFTESMYLYLFSRLRRLKAMDVPLRLRAASNPGGEGHEWAKARFIPEDYTKDQGKELKVWTKTFVDDEQKEITTQFVPSRITDNPALDQATYIDGLGKLDRVTREQLLYGDWAISPTGRTYFNPDALALFKAMPAEIGELVFTENRLGEKRLIFQRREDGMLSVWRTPVAGRRYVMGCDAALGKDANKGEGKVDPDWSVVQVREQETGEQVARFRGRISEAFFGEYWVRLHRWYNNAFVVPAVTGGYGRAALVSAMATGLEAKYVYWREDETGMPGRRPTGAPDLGFTESVATRPVLYSLLDTAIIQHAIETYDAVTINEYYAFEINKDGKPQARAGTKDDCVTADALCVKGMQVAPRVIKPALGSFVPRRKYGGPQAARDWEEERYWREQMKPTGSRLDRG